MAVETIRSSDHPLKPEKHEGESPAMAQAAQQAYSSQGKETTPWKTDAPDTPAVLVLDAAHLYGTSDAAGGPKPPATQARTDAAVLPPVRTPEQLMEDLKGVQSGDQPFKVPQGSSLEAVLDKRLGRLQPWEIPGAAKEIFAKLDKDHSGTLSPQELADAVQDSSLTGKSAQVVASLYRIQSGLRTLNGKEAGGAGGISMKDIEALGDLKKTGEFADVMRMTAAATTLFYNEKHFQIRLEARSIEERLKAGDLKDDERKTLSFALKGYDILTQLGSTPGHPESSLTGKAISNLNRLTEKSDESERISHALKTVIADVNRSHLFGSKELFHDTPDQQAVSADATQQGSIGDCYYEAVPKRADQVHDMIQDNNDGTYTVRFAGEPWSPQTVSTPTEAEQGLFNHGTTHGLWASVLEKAYGQYLKTHPDEDTKAQDNNIQFGRKEPMVVPPAANADGGAKLKDNPWKALELLTGKPAEPHYLGGEQEPAAKQALIDAFKYGKAAIMASKPPSEMPPDSGVTPGHMYTIMGFDPNGPNGGTLTLRDPYGESSSLSKNGTGKFTISWQAAQSAFLAEGIEGSTFLERLFR